MTGASPRHARSTTVATPARRPLLRRLDQLRHTCTTISITPVPYTPQLPRPQRQSRTPHRHTCAPTRHSRVGRPLHILFPPPARGGAEGGGGPAPPGPIWYPRRQDPLSRSATAPPARGSKLIKGLRRRESRSERQGRCVAEHVLAALTSELASARYPRPRTAMTAIPLAGVRQFLRWASGWLEWAQFSWVALVVDMSLGRACTLGAMTHLTWTLAVNRVAVAVPGGRVFRV